MAGAAPGLDAGGALAAARLVVTPADTAQDLTEKYGITAERAGDGSPDLKWLRPAAAPFTGTGAGDTLPFAIEAFPGREHNDLVLWRRRTVDYAPTMPLVVGEPTQMRFQT